MTIDIPIGMSKETSFCLTLPSSYTKLIVADSVKRGLRNPQSGVRLTLRECCHSILCMYVEEVLLDNNNNMGSK